MQSCVKSAISNYKSFHFNHMLITCLVGYSILVFFYLWMKFIKGRVSCIFSSRDTYGNVLLLIEIVP